MNGDEYRLQQASSLSDEDLTLIRIEAYRSGYSCGYSDGKNGVVMRDKDAASLFYGVHVPDVFQDAQTDGGMEAQKKDL